MESWFTMYFAVVHCWFTVGSLLVHCWFTMGLQHFSDAERDCALGAPSWQEAPGTQGVWGKPGAQMCHARQVRQAWRVRQVRQCATSRPRAPGEPGAPRATSAPFIAHIDPSARPCRCREPVSMARIEAPAQGRGRPLGVAR